jgi:transposase
MDLTNEQWQVIEPILPPDRVRADGRGRPWSDRRTVLNGILWILRTGARWQDLPPQYGPYQTVHRRFQDWVRSQVLEEVLLAVAQDLKDRGGLDLRECFIDGTFVPAKKGGAAWEKPSGGRAANSWRLRTVTVFLSPYAQTVLVRLK